MSQAVAAAEQHLEAGRLAKAEAVCRQILTADPLNAEALHLIGVVACEAKQYELAVAFISKAVAIEGGRASFHTSLGRAYRMVGRLDEAVKSCWQALQNSSTFADAHYELGSALYQKGDVVGAITHCRRAIDVKPHHAKAHERIAAAHLMLGDFKTGWWEHEWRRRERRGFSTAMAGRATSGRTDPASCGRGVRPHAAMGPLRTARNSAWRPGGARGTA